MLSDTIVEDISAPPSKNALSSSLNLVQTRTIWKASNPFDASAKRACQQHWLLFYCAKMLDVHVSILHGPFKQFAPGHFFLTMTWKASCSKATPSSLWYPKLFRVNPAPRNKRTSDMHLRKCSVGTVFDVVSQLRHTDPEEHTSRVKREATLAKLPK